MRIDHTRLLTAPGALAVGLVIIAAAWWVRRDAEKEE